MSMLNKIVEKEKKIAIVGLGYVGLPLAVAFAKKADVIGYDINKQKIDLYNKGIDVTGEIGSEILKQVDIFFTSEPKYLDNAGIIIICVPTPINSDHSPDLSPVLSASKIVGENISRNTIIVFESTVYPGYTEKKCIPILEECSGLKCGQDFKVGYSPERVNPGDKIHTLENICKIISAIDTDTLEEIKQIYELIIKAGTYTVSSIKTAEAIKLCENSQRDINIAFMNEMAMVFKLLDIDTNEVIEGMNTKWNSLGFKPGLVGGHCIGVDPYYFTYETEKLGYHSQIVHNGRIINENMASYIADIAIKQMILAGQAPAKSKVAIFGLTFKENCTDIRNSKIFDIYKRLQAYNINPIVIDPKANSTEAFIEYGIELITFEEVFDIDCAIIAVAHDEFKSIGLENIKRRYKNVNDNIKVLIDVKGMFSLMELKNSGVRYWRL